MTGLELSKRLYSSRDGHKHSDVADTAAERPHVSSSPARFINARSQQDEITIKNSRSTAISSQPWTFSSDDTEHTIDITDDSHGRRGLLSNRVQPLAGLHQSSDHDDESILLLKHIPVNTGVRLDSSTAPSPHGQQPRFRKHAPVPATVLFAHDAAPLHLPKLDKYLSSIPPPKFSRVVDQHVPFPPMGNLAKLGMSLDDLEHNRKQVPAWRNRSSILGSAVNIILGLMVCSN
jgi:hypothetical protein